MFQYALNDAKSVVYLFYFFISFFLYYADLENFVNSDSPIKNMNNKDNSDIDNFKDTIDINSNVEEFKHNYFEEFRLNIINLKETQKAIRSFVKPPINMMRLILIESYMSVLDHIKISEKEYYDKIEIN